VDFDHHELSSTYDRDGRLIDFSESFGRIFGATEDMLGSLPPFAWWPPENAAEIATVLDCVLNNPRSQQSTIGMVLSLLDTRGKIVFVECGYETDMRGNTVTYGCLMGDARSLSHASAPNASELLDQLRLILDVIDEAPRPVSAAVLSKVQDLSVRERTVLVHFLNGRRATEIAPLLGISPHTVRNHRKAIFAKLGVSSQIELMGQLHAEDLTRLLQPDGDAASSH
jgi:PAS domain S-box-containing protein